MSVEHWHSYIVHVTGNFGKPSKSMKMHWHQFTFSRRFYVRSAFFSPKGTLFHGTDFWRRMQCVHVPWTFVQKCEIVEQASAFLGQSQIWQVQQLILPRDMSWCTKSIIWYFPVSFKGQHVPVPHMSGAHGQHNLMQNSMTWPFPPTDLIT